MREFRGTYYDGETSEPHPVTLSLDEQAQQLVVAGLSEPARFALGSIRMSARLGNTARSLHFPDGAKCESDDHECLDELERRAGRGGLLRFVHALESKRGYVLVAAALLIVTLLAGAKWGVPLAAERAAAGMPSDMAYDLGRGTLEVLDSSLLRPSQLSEAVRARLEAQFQRMAEQYPRLPLTLTFRRGIGPNALALPDGTVIATDELVNLADDDQEVLAVLAHEIGHVHHRHSLRMALESSAVAILVGAYLGDVTQLTALSAALPGVYAQAHYSREHETEADTFALAHLERSGIPRHHFAKIMRALQKELGAEPENGLQYLASHPPTAERIRRFER
jgi:Zn-dependent protease with chaperone function